MAAEAEGSVASDRAASVAAPASVAAASAEAASAAAGAAVVTGDRRSRARIFSAMTWLGRAAVNARVEASEDPPTKLDELDAALAMSIAEAEQAAVRAITNLRALEGDLGEAILAEADWAGKARASFAPGTLAPRQRRGRGGEPIRRAGSVGCSSAGHIWRRRARAATKDRSAGPPAERSKSELSGLRTARAAVRTKRARTLHEAGNVPA